MSLVRKLLVAVLPKSWADSMEAESRQWMLQCKCGREISVWDAGGVRWKASGEPWRWFPCPKCGMTWHKVYFKKDPAGPKPDGKVAS